MPSNAIQMDYPHLEFQKCWRLTEAAAINLGKCVAWVQAIGMLPVPPAVQRELRAVSFQRGAQATTAIEGNTLTDDELRKVLEGQELPKSRQYQSREVTNVLGAMNEIWNSVIEQSKHDLITTKLLCHWNGLVGKELGPLYDGIPGKLRRTGGMKRSLSEFMSYSIQGLADGLNEVVNTVQVETLKTAWESHIYRTFSEYTDYNKKNVFKRRRTLALAMPITGQFAPLDLVRGSNELFEEYMNRDLRMLKNDMQVLLDLSLAVPAEGDEEQFQANVRPMMIQQLPARSNPQVQ